MPTRSRPEPSIWAERWSCPRSTLRGSARRSSPTRRAPRSPPPSSCPRTRTVRTRRSRGRRGSCEHDRIDLPVMPPVAPMLAKPVATIPPGQLYEPKWDGFRSIVFRDGDEVEIGSRKERPMTRYFPEVLDAVRRSFPPRAVIDGEIVIAGDGGLHFWALQQRIHPAASRVTRLAAETPASFIAFDLLALGDDDLTSEPFAQRRAALAQAPARAARGGPRGGAVRAAPRRPRAGAGERGTADPRHSSHARRDDRPCVVRPLRGGRARRPDRQAARSHLRARQAGDVEDQARADGGLRGRRLPRPQDRARRDRVAPARPLRRRDGACLAVERPHDRARPRRRRRRLPDGPPA